MITAAFVALAHSAFGPVDTVLLLTYDRHHSDAWCSAILGSGMPQFTFLFRIEPPGDFGLPEHETIVTNATANLYTPSIHRLTMNVVGHGTISRYREENEAVECAVDNRGLNMRLRDNYLWVVVEKDEYKVAERVVLDAVNRFIQLLSVDRGTYFTAEFLHATFRDGSDERLARHPKRVLLGKVKIYNLQATGEGVRRAFDSVSLTVDTQLAKALDYFNHAQFLNSVRDQLPLGNARAYSHLVADIFSNYYRAASAIAGDPKKDKDYQSRYRKIGLSDDDWHTIERVRKLRNDYGVAHYDLGDKMKQLESELAMAVEITKKVITCQISDLRSKGQSQGGKKD